jgi:hypothetical protein
MTLDELKYIVAEICKEHGSYGCKWVDDDYLPEQLTLVEQGEIEDQGKYQYQSDVYVCDQGNHFMITNSRSGSYYSDYEPGEPHVYQVEPKVVTKTFVEWHAVK